MAYDNHNKLKLLLIAQDKFPPFRADIALLFGKKIVDRGHRIDWLLQSDKTLRRAYETQWLGSKVWVGPTDNGASALCKLKKNLHRFFHDMKVFTALKRTRYDFMIVRDRFVTGTIALIASKIYKVKFIYWLSWPFPEAYIDEHKEKRAKYPYLYTVRGHLLKFLLYRIILPYSNHIFVQTVRMQENIANHGIPKDKMTPVLMGVSVGDIPFFGYPGTNNGHNHKTIVYLGALDKIRKIDFLLCAFNKVLKEERNARLYLVGGCIDDSDERNLKQQILRFNLDNNTVITGFLPQKEAWEYVRYAQVCVSPIRPSPLFDCGSPTKLIEYMAMGKAAVANDHPEQHQVLGESRGGICVPYEENAFAQAILYLLKNQQEAKAMGIRGRKYVEEKRNYDLLTDLVEHTLLSL